MKYVLVPIAFSESLGKTLSFRQLVWLSKPLEDGRPFFKIEPYTYTNNEAVWVYAYDEMHKWFRELNIEYSIHLDPDPDEYSRFEDWYYFVFKKESDALIFKLTWGGK